MRLHWSFEIVAVITIAAGWRGTAAHAGDRQRRRFLDRPHLWLEDRVTTAHQILRKAGRSARLSEPDRLMRPCLADKKAASVAPYRLRAWHAVGLIGIAAFWPFQ